MDKLIIFTDFTSLIVPSILTEATLRAVVHRSDVVIVGVCVRNPQNYQRLLLRHARAWMARKIQYFFDHNQKRTFAAPLPINIESLARRHGFQILEPPCQDINDPDFIGYLKTSVRPTIALSYYCLQRFSPLLLDTFESAANYHNGLLPKYRGRKATNWSVYHGDRETSFTFHRMNEALDKGHILLQGMVAIRPDASVADLEQEKALAAANDIPRLLDMLVNREAGRAQAGEGNYFSLRDFQHIRRIDDPSEHSSAELSRRLRAFGVLMLTMGGARYEVTKLATTSERPKARGGLSFRASDGVIMRPTRFCYLPFPLYRALRWTGWRLPGVH